MASSYPQSNYANYANPSSFPQPNYANGGVGGGGLYNTQPVGSIFPLLRSPPPNISFKNVMLCTFFSLNESNNRVETGIPNAHDAISHDTIPPDAISHNAIPNNAILYERRRRTSTGTSTSAAKRDRQEEGVVF